jgi:hypothetical protein
LRPGLYAVAAQRLFNVVTVKPCPTIAVEIRKNTNMATPLKGSCFLASGEDGLRSFSTDGVLWSEPVTDREGVLLSHVAFAGGRCVAAGRYGGEQRAYSTSDGVDWEMSKFPVRPYVTRVDVLFAENDQFTAILNDDGASPATITSADGKTWSDRQDILEDWKVMRHDAHTICSSPWVITEPASFDVVTRSTGRRFRMQRRSIR